MEEVRRNMERQGRHRETRRDSERQVETRRGRDRK